MESKRWINFHHTFTKPFFLLQACELKASSQLFDYCIFIFRQYKLRKKLDNIVFWLEVLREGNLNELAKANQDSDILVLNLNQFRLLFGVGPIGFEIFWLSIPQNLIEIFIQLEIVEIDYFHRLKSCTNLSNLETLNI